MKNSYEMAEGLELGSAELNILGSKPVVMDEFDAIWGVDRMAIALPNDIDEGE